MTYNLDTIITKLKDSGAKTVREVGWAMRQAGYNAGHWSIGQEICEQVLGKTPTKRTMYNLLSPCYHTEKSKLYKREVAKARLQTFEGTVVQTHSHMAHRSRQNGTIDQLMTQEDLLALVNEAFTLGPWSGVLDHKINSPWKFSPNRLDNSKGYSLGNVEIVPINFNLMLQGYPRNEVIKLIVDGTNEEPDFDAFEKARPGTKKIVSYITARVMANHPNLKKHKDEIQEKIRAAVFQYGCCSVTGLPFVCEQRNPRLPSMDLIDYKKGPKTVSFCQGGHCSRTHGSRREGGSETPDDMRLVCAFVNMGRFTWGDEVLHTLLGLVRNIGGLLR
jgi:hypothetical protein